MTTAENEKSYAHRVHDIYLRVSGEFGETDANLFNELVRGASLLDEGGNKFLSDVESLDQEQLAKYIKDLRDNEEEWKREYGANTFYGVFEKVLEIGKTKLLTWKDGSYQEMELTEEEHKILPWAGKIQLGGPKPAITGVMLISQKCEIDLYGSSIVIDGHKFSALSETAYDTH